MNPYLKLKNAEHKFDEVGKHFNTMIVAYRFNEIPEHTLKKAHDLYNAMLKEYKDAVAELPYLSDESYNNFIGEKS